MHLLIQMKSLITLIILTLPALTFAVGTADENGKDRYTYTNFINSYPAQIEAIENGEITKPAMVFIKKALPMDTSSLIWLFKVTAQHFPKFQAKGRLKEINELIKARTDKITIDKFTSVHLELRNLIFQQKSATEHRLVLWEIMSKHNLWLPRDLPHILTGYSLHKNLGHNHQVYEILSSMIFKLDSYQQQQILDRMDSSKSSTLEYYELMFAMNRLDLKGVTALFKHIAMRYADIELGLLPDNIATVKSGLHEWVLLKILNDYGKNPQLERWKYDQTKLLKIRLQNGRVKRTLQQLEMEAPILIDLIEGKMPPVITKHRYPTPQKACEASLQY